MKDPIDQEVWLWFNEKCSYYMPVSIKVWSFSGKLEQDKDQGMGSVKLETISAYSVIKNDKKIFWDLGYL